MPFQRRHLHHYNGVGDLPIRLALDGKLAEDEFGFTLDAAGIAPVDLHFHFAELERVLEKAERIMPEPLRGLPWLGQVESVVRELEAADGHEPKRKSLATIALYLAHTRSTESRGSRGASKTMMERERQQHLDTGRVYIFMMIGADGGVEINLFDQVWFEGDDWILENQFADIERDRPCAKGIRELILMEKIIDTGMRRKARSGRFGAVFAIIPSTFH